MLAVAAIVSAYVGRSNIGHAALHQRWTRRSLSPAMAEPEIETPARGFLPFLQGGVPEGQQPLNELRELQRKPFYDWAEDDSYSEKLTRVYQLCMLFVSLPISYVTFDQFPSELPQVFLSANIGAHQSYQTMLGSSASCMISSHVLAPHPLQGRSPSCCPSSRACVLAGALCHRWAAAEFEPPAHFLLGMQPAKKFCS